MSIQADRCGVLYVATQREKYLVEAVASALSLKRYCPNVPVCLFTDLTESNLIDNDCFNYVMPISSDTACGTKWARGLRTKVLSLSKTPFERTVFIDTDTRILSPAIDGLFDILDDYQIAMVEDPSDVSIGVKHYGSRMFNSGVILYRKCNTIMSLFEQWQNLFLAQLEAHAQDPMPSIDYMDTIQDETIRRKMMLHDQLALVQILSPEKNVLDVKLKSLDEAWNFCATFSGRSLDRPIHIEHGLHLKADAFSRHIYNSKPNSFGDFNGRLISNVAKALVELEEGSSAGCLAILKKVVASIPNQSLIQVPLASEILKRNKFEAVCEHATQALIADPECYSAFELLVTALFNQGDIDGAADYVKRCLSRFPKRMGILRLAHIIHAEKPVLDDSIGLPNYEAFLVGSHLNLDRSLHQWLEDFILHQRLLETERPEGTPENAYRSSILSHLAGPGINLFRNALRSPIQNYINRIIQHDHPFVKALPSKMEIACWGAVMGAGADRVHCTHNNACISGIYVLRVPESSRTSRAERAGWLEFGRPPVDHYRYTFTPRTIEIQPTEGTLLLFPSHYWHGVIPHTSKDLSISMGFDVFPAKS